MIKAVINGKAAQPEKPKYPYIGVYDDSIDRSVVLFIDNDKGVCLETNCKSDSVGEYSDKWKEANFTPIKGSITLSNE